MTKLERIQQWTAENSLDFTYISDPTTIEYLTGFASDPHERILALLVFPNQSPFLFTPALEVESAREAGVSFDIYGYLDHENPWAIIADKIRQRNNHPTTAGLDKIAFPVDHFEKLTENLTGVTFNKDISGLIDSMRAIKTEDEIQKMILAGQEADFAFETGFKAVKPGVKEVDVVAELEYALMKKGVMEMSFNTLVQAGKHAAEPHGESSTNVIENNQLVLFDLGTVHDGYMSDASRTVAVGKPSDKELDMHKVCLEAQLKAMDAVKPGITAEELDKIARDVITKAGYGEYFIHRLGHGIGMGTHEFPSIMQGNQMELKPGMCFSIEPGIYVPGFAGVRIEDCVYVTEDGSKPFTHTPKNLIYVDK
ncbi:M24 family metallopeptidase [Apilactobacillus ozensis]|uniref:Proline dipeptidase n=1 Tax=Apilactobacillus ozensis DSM 23829 = JCM 17196 TaxID=1423781 RepID=A0A0R2B2A5_9LACO|nr:Xaa-Pro peptidase family protein [Apilactobacillus ozensis]KRM69571.1 proline dipeptidase [Apilactobacillus ozensis DSM 23829 = JCM 17196]MCK8607433.1 Xaa-Pro peptidase family protein [Apilactobacillus ozensis]